MNQVNRVEPIGGSLWRVERESPLGGYVVEIIRAASMREAMELAMGPKDQ